MHPHPTLDAVEPDSPHIHRPLVRSAFADHWHHEALLAPFDQ